MKVPRVLLSLSFSQLHSEPPPSPPLGWRQALYRGAPKRTPYVWRQCARNCTGPWKAKRYKQESEGVAETEDAGKKSITASQTKVSFSKSAGGKLIPMTMIGALISSPSEILPILVFQCPPPTRPFYSAFWCLTEWKARRYFCGYTEGTPRSKQS